MPQTPQTYIEVHHKPARQVYTEDSDRITSTNPKQLKSNLFEQTEILDRLRTQGKEPNKQKRSAYLLLKAT
jgi:hypothetical protein